MGQLVTTIAGGFIGFAIGGPLGAQIGMTLGGMVGSTLFGPTIKGPRLSDLKVTASTYGVVIPEIFGTVRAGGNLIWTTGIKETKKKSSGKGGPKQTTYSYNATFALGICKGPITGLTRVWADGKLIYDTTNGATRKPTPGDGVQALVAFIAGAKKKKAVNFRLYLGDEDQLPDSLIVADKGDKTSAHRDLAYVVFEKMDLTDFGNRIPQLTFEVTKQLTNNFPSIVARTEEGARPSGVQDRMWIPDWNAGRLLSFYGSLEIYNLETMTRVATGSGIPEGYSSLRRKYIQGENIWMITNNLRNSGRVDFYDTRNFAYIRGIGNNSNSLDGGYNAGNNSLSLANAGEIGYGHYSNGAGYHIMTIGWTRAVWCFPPDGSVPIFKTFAAFEPHRIMEGNTSGDRSEMIAWRNASSKLQMEVYHVGATVKGERRGNAWVQGAWSKTRIDLQAIPGEYFAASVLLFDKTDNHLFMLGNSGGVVCAAKYSLDTQTWKFVRKLPGVPFAISGAEHSRLNGSTFGYLTRTSGGISGRLIQISLQDGSVVRNTAYGQIWGDQNWGGGEQHWDDVTESLLVETRNEYRRIAFANSVQEIGVRQIVESVCLKGGVLTEEDIDASQLDNGKLTGYMIDREASAQDVIRQLATGFLFDGYESDFQLKFRSRGDASQVTIPESWIGRQSDGQVVKETLTQELEMPMRVSINYYDVARDHQKGTQSAKRKAGPVETMLTRKEDIVELPIAWTADDAKQCADKLLKMTWAGRTAYGLSLPFRYLKYDPSDVATVVLDNGATYSMRFTEATVGADFTMEMQGTSEKAAAYTSTAIGSGGEAPLQTIPLDYPADPVILNVPLLRDMDYDTSGNSSCYFTASTDNFTFNGATLFIDDNYDYIAVGTIGKDAVSGYTTTKLPAVKHYESTDETTVLTVFLSNAEDLLESVTQEEMLNGFVNAALVGDEVIQYRDAVQQSNKSWKITGILRARRGTNYAINSHTTSDRFICLDEESVSRFVRPPLQYVGKRNFKAVTTNQLVEDAKVTTADLIPRDLMPLTPEDIKISDDDTTVTVSMQRRSRVTAPLEDGVSLIHYKEGDKLSAKISLKMWLGFDLDDTGTVTVPDKEDFIQLFDPAGNDLAATYSFPLADLDGATKFLVRLAEIGVVEGTPKFVAFERLGLNRWNQTDLY